MPTLPVELNGDGVHSIRTPHRFTTNQPFSIELENLGRSTHVHLHLDDDLDRVASLSAVNHFVEDDAFRRIHVPVTEVAEPVSGKLKIVTGYGSGVTYVEITVEPPSESEEVGVIVDRSFEKPPPKEPEPSIAERIGIPIHRVVENGGVPAIAFALIAVVLAIAVAIAVDSVLVLLAVGVVLGATIAAIVFMSW